MQKPNIRLYTYAFSPYAAKVHFYLGFKELAFKPFYVHPARVASELPTGHQVPVLTINDEARNDSTAIGLWLDELYPDARRLLPEDVEERRHLLAIDAWVSDSLIPVIFRLMLAVGETPAAKLRNRRRGARAAQVTMPGGLPLLMRWFYPLLITRPPFIQKLIRSTDLSKTNLQLLEQIFAEFHEHFAGGPFLGGRLVPSLADLSAYAQFALTFMAGYDHSLEFARHQEMLVWFYRVGTFLDGCKSLLPPELVAHSLGNLAQLAADQKLAEAAESGIIPEAANDHQ